MFVLVFVQLAVVRQVLRKELGLKIVEVESDKALVEGGDVLWTGTYRLYYFAVFAEMVFIFKNAIWFWSVF